jgi:ABC-type oligopeptide transport system ATPase subunit
MALRPRGPYPVLGVHGEQGSGKSTAARMIRSLIDPYAVLLRSEPKEARDLMIAAKG